MKNLVDLKLILDYDTNEKLNAEGQVTVKVKDIINMCKENIKITQETLDHIKNIDENDNVKNMLDKGQDEFIKFNKEVIDALQFIEPEKELTFWKE